MCVQIFSVNVLSTSGTHFLMMSVSTLFIGFDAVSCVLICLVTLGIVVGLVDFHYVLSILRVLLILSRLFRATISVLFVPCCPVLLSFYLVLSYMFERNKWKKNKWRQCRTSFALKFRPFDKVERCFDIVASVDWALERLFMKPGVTTFTTYKKTLIATTDGER